MQDAEPKEGASGDWQASFGWKSLYAYGVNGVFHFREGGSFKLRLGTRRFGDSFHFFFTRDEFQLSCLKKGKALRGDAKNHCRNFGGGRSGPQVSAFVAAHVVANMQSIQRYTN